MKGFLTETLETILMALVIFLLLQASVQNFRVEGASMIPTLTEGEYLLVNKISYMKFPLGGATRVIKSLPVDPDLVVYPFPEPERGTIVIFRFPGDPRRFFVKRIIGVPGDLVEIRRGKVYINTKIVDEPYLERSDRSTMATITVPHDSYFVLGDNRRYSNDSRDWSFTFVPRTHLIGQAWVTYGPFHQLDRLYPSKGLS
jgi:signal peptidase I